MGVMLGITTHSPFLKVELSAKSTLDTQLKPIGTPPFVVMMQGGFFIKTEYASIWARNGQIPHQIVSPVVVYV